MSTPSSMPAAGTPVEPARPSMSQLSRIFSIFFAPRKTFEDVRIKAGWWAPWAFAAIFSLAFGAVAVQKLDMTTLVRHQIEQSKMAQRQMESLSPEQRDRGIAIRAAVTKITFYVLPVFSLIVGIVIAAVLMGLFNFGFGAEVSFDRCLAIVFYSFLPGVISAILIIVTLLVTPDLSSFNMQNPVATNPAFFMDQQSNPFLYSIASRVDIIAIWILVLLGLGFSTVSKKKLSSSTAIITMFVVYGLYALGAAGLAAAF